MNKQIPKKDHYGKKLLQSEYHSFIHSLLIDNKALCIIAYEGLTVSMRVLSMSDVRRLLSLGSPLKKHLLSNYVIVINSHGTFGLASVDIATVG